MDHEQEEQLRGESCDPGKGDSEEFRYMMGLNVDVRPGLKQHAWNQDGSRTTPRVGPVTSGGALAVQHFLLHL